MDHVLQAIGDRIGGTPAQVIFKWLQSKGVVIVTWVQMMCYYRVLWLTLAIWTARQPRLRDCRSIKPLLNFVRLPAVLSVTLTYYTWSSIADLTDDEIAAIEEAGAKGPTPNKTKIIRRLLGTVAIVAAFRTIIFGLLASHNWIFLRFVSLMFCFPRNVCRPYVWASVIGYAFLSYLSIFRSIWVLN